MAHNDLPTFEKLTREGGTVLSPDRAGTQDIREMHIGLLNMMPDAALEATEKQFFRLIGESNKIAQFYVHPFSLPEIERSEKSAAYIEKYYEPFEKLQNDGLDALIITGANVADPDLENNAFWEPLQKVMDWSWNNVTSTITACLASHAVMQFKYGQKRTPFDRKHTGIFKSRVRQRSHPLVQGMNTVFDVPHSRHNTITWTQFETAGMRILVNSHEGGVHMATSPDGFRLVCMQGHQEYDTVSILKEYRRDLELFLDGKIEQPDIPQHYFSSEALEIIKRYLENPGGIFPEQDIAPLIENTWKDSARAIIGNWIGQVYQTTHVDRTKHFMDGINPDNPLGL
ncbi:MAG: homoserine O-succinyltransferase [Alphaproteobacteria bacterium]